MTADNSRNGGDMPIEALDEEATGIDRPGLHAPEGARPQNESFGDVLARNLARRSFLLGAAATVPVLMTASSIPSLVSEAEAAPGDLGSERLKFTPIQPSKADRVTVPNGYDHSVIVKWGDPLFEDAPEFRIASQTAENQSQQFGYNCDFVGFFPLNGGRSALLCVNHEYTSGTEMFRGYVPGAKKRETDVEIAAHGGSVVEVRKTDGVWEMVKSDRYNRRITGDTPMRITGPAAGHRLMKTSEDPSGERVNGMLNNCAGGKTPWGTWLSCEENFNQYFANNDLAEDEEVKTAHTRYGLPAAASQRQWEKFHDRFDVSKEPNEAFRFGWTVEIDPYDPTFVPRKRTALGRTKHEAAACVLTTDNRVVVYMGDDQQFDYVYKFVSRGRYNPGRRQDNFDLLDNGTLYVAKFDDDNTGRWLELSMKNPKLAKLFSNDGEILVKTRLAADAVGATAMDRPEDCQPNPVNGKVYLTMTNNVARTEVPQNKGEAAANPRAPNFGGHIIELTEERDDYAAETFRWEIFLLCGNPEIDLKTKKKQLDPGLASSATFFAGYADASKLGKVASPDNISFDSRGNLWIATDGQPNNVDIDNVNDALHVVPTEGPDRGYLRQFLSGPRGCEVCGAEFTPDEKQFFCSIQHPGEEGGFPNTVSRWPDRERFARSAVIAVRKADGRKIGL